MHHVLQGSWSCAIPEGVWGTPPPRSLVVPNHARVSPMISFCFCSERRRGDPQEEGKADIEYNDYAPPPPLQEELLELCC